MSIGPANDKRDEILSYLDDIAKLQKQLREALDASSVVASHLRRLEDRIKMLVVEEIDGNGGPAPQRRARKTRIEQPDFEPLTPGAVGNPPPKLVPGKRACSICRRPGHRATTCPQKG